MKRSKRFSKNTRSRRKIYKNKSKSRIRKLKSKKVKRGGSSNASNEESVVFELGELYQTLSLKLDIFGEKPSIDYYSGIRIRPKVEINHLYKTLQLKCGDDYTYKFILNINVEQAKEMVDFDDEYILSKYYKSLLDDLNKQTETFTEIQKIIFFWKFISEIGKKKKINIEYCPSLMKYFKDDIYKITINASTAKRKVIKKDLDGVDISSNPRIEYVRKNFTFCGPKFSKEIKKAKEYTEEMPITEKTKAKHEILIDYKFCEDLISELISRALYEHKYHTQKEIEGVEVVEYVMSTDADRDQGDRVANIARTLLERLKRISLITHNDLVNYLITENKSDKYNIVELLGLQDEKTCEKCKKTFERFPEHTIY